VEELASTAKECSDLRRESSELQLRELFVAGGEWEQDRLGPALKGDVVG
jgi:hypothetical protein